MPAQILVTHAQLETLVDTGSDVILTEAHPHVQVLDCWVLDGESMDTATHRSLVIEPDGNVLGDERLED